MILAVERLIDAQPELEALAVAHHQEMATAMDLDVQWSALASMEGSGCLQCLIARDPAGKVAGYLIAIICLHPLYGCLWAEQVALYVVPEERTKGLAMTLIQESDRLLRSRGVQITTQSVRFGGANYGPMLERIGYQSAELVYHRRLES